MIEKDPLIKPGRPKLKVDILLIVHLREDEHLGWSRGAEEYRKRTVPYISRDTFKRRYLERKNNPGFSEFIDDLLKKINNGSTTKE